MEQVKQVVARLEADNISQSVQHRKVARPWGAYDSVDLGERHQVKRITVRPGAKLSLHIDALRDWGHAKDYVRMQWLMLQQDQPEDFVIATGIQYSVRQFIEKTATALGMQLRWEGTSINEVGYWTNRHCEQSAVIQEVPIIKIDPRYFRPTEVASLIGDPTKAKEKLGWVPEITAQEMCAEMVAYDLAEAKKNALLKKHGYQIAVSGE
jgi:GDPmannose 4,6-dehydratase